MRHLLCWASTIWPAVFMVHHNHEGHARSESDPIIIAPQSKFPAWLKQIVLTIGFGILTAVFGYEVEGGRKEAAQFANIETRLSEIEERDKELQARFDREIIGSRRFEDFREANATDHAKIEDKIRDLELLIRRTHRP